MDVFHSHYHHTQHKKSVKRYEEEIILEAPSPLFATPVQPTQHFSATWLFIAPFRRRRCMLLIPSEALVNTDEHLHCLPKIPTYIFHPQTHIHFVAKHRKSVLR
jgi:hypothetical protein